MTVNDEFLKDMEKILFHCRPDYPSGGHRIFCYELIVNIASNHGAHIIVTKYIEMHNWGCKIIGSINGVFGRSISIHSSKFTNVIVEPCDVNMYWFEEDTEKLFYKIPK